MCFGSSTDRVLENMDFCFRCHSISQNFTPDFSVPYTNSTIEYETWSEITGQRFGIVLNWVPSENFPRQYHLCNYQFQRNSTMQYTSTMVVFRDGLSEDNLNTQIWSHQKPLKSSLARKEGQKSGTLVVSSQQLDALTNFRSSTIRPFGSWVTTKFRSLVNLTSGLLFLSNVSTTSN